MPMSFRVCDAKAHAHAHDLKNATRECAFAFFLVCVYVCVFVCVCVSAIHCQQTNAKAIDECAADTQTLTSNHRSHNRPSVGPSVRRSVGPSVGRSLN